MAGTSSVHSEDDDEYLQASWSFHDIIGKASGNAVLDLLSSSLKNIYAARVNPSVFAFGERDEVFDTHESIAEAILAGNATQAEREMQDHMREMVERVDQRFPGQMDVAVDWF